MILTILYETQIIASCLEIVLLSVAIILLVRLILLVKKIDKQNY